MKKALLGLVLLSGAIFAAPRVSIGVNIGVPAPPAYYAVRPACPGPGYVWTDGYWDGGVWIQGYWQPPVRYYAPAPAYGYGNSYGYRDRDDYRYRDYDRDRRYDRHDHDRYDRDRHYDRGERYEHGFRR